MKLVVAYMALLMLVAFKLPAQEVETDHSSTFDFSRLQTFAVKVGTPWGDPSVESAAKSAVTKRLTEKGWKESDEASSDALVILHGTSPGKQTFREFYRDLPGLGWHNVGAPALADSSDYEYKPGALIVDIFDAKTRKVVFRGVAQNLTGKPANKDQKIDKAAKKMFKDLPSGKSSKEKSNTENQEPATPPL